MTAYGRSGRLPFMRLSDHVGRHRRRSQERPSTVALEGVQLAHVDDEVERLADAGTSARVEPADQLFAAVLDIDVDFAAERLDHRHRGAERGRLVYAARHILRVVNILGANAEGDR